MMTSRIPSKSHGNELLMYGARTGFIKIMTMTVLTTLMVLAMLMAFFLSRPDVPLTEYRELEDLIKVQENLEERNTRR